MLDPEWQEVLQKMQSIAEETQKKNLQPTMENLSTTIKCDKCFGRGWILFEENGVEMAKECDCGLNEYERNRNKLKFANVPIVYQNATLKDFKAKYGSQADNNIAKAIYNSIKYWLENLNTMEDAAKGLYMWSIEKGSGKTLLASMVANELMSTYHKQVKFSTSMQIINEIKDSWDRESGKSESKLLRDLSNVEYLVIDDFGTEKVKDWVADRFYQIINSRYIEKKMTIYTSNYNIKDLPYDDRIGNRILERSFNIHFPEKSVREVKAAVENRLGSESNNN